MALSSKLILQSRAKSLSSLVVMKGLISSSEAVGLDEGLVEALHELDRFVDLRRLQAEREGQLPRLVGLEADSGIDVGLVDGVGSLAATSSISMPPACEAMKTSFAAARSSTMPR